MKKIIFFCFSMLCITYVSAQKNIVKANLLIGNVGVQFERSLTSHISLTAHIGYSKGSITVNDVKTSSDGFGYYLEGRYYFSSKKDLMEGFHFGPYYYEMHLSNKRNRKGSLNSLGLVTGYQWVLNSKITAGITAGAGTLSITGDIAGLYLFKLFKVYPNFGISVGYNF